MVSILTSNPAVRNTELYSDRRIERYIEYLEAERAQLNFGELVINHVRAVWLCYARFCRTGEQTDRRLCWRSIQHAADLISTVEEFEQFDDFGRVA
jgi:hypothetical protein